jgi:hypothetical protein
MWHKKISFDSINAIHKYFINQDDIIWYVLQYIAALWVTLATKAGTCVVLHPTVMCTGTTIPWNCSLFLWFFISVLGQICCDVSQMNSHQYQGNIFGIILRLTFSWPMFHSTESVHQYVQFSSGMTKLSVVPCYPRYWMDTTHLVNCNNAVSFIII